MLNPDHLTVGEQEGRFGFVVVQVGEEGFQVGNRIDCIREIPPPFTSTCLKEFECTVLPGTLLDSSWNHSPKSSRRVQAMLSYLFIFFSSQYVYWLHELLVSRYKQLEVLQIDGIDVQQEIWRPDKQENRVLFKESDLGLTFSTVYSPIFSEYVIKP